MSNSLAIAAVTKTLLNLITHGVPDLPNQKVTTLPPEKARKTNEDQLNIFLYHTPLNAAWRNMDMPRQIRPGETGQPPLGLNLHYLITGYGKDDDDILGQQWLGKAMSILHDHPVLGAQEIKSALAASGLQDQIERVRITPQSISLDEMSKLWTAFQAPYRISMAYQVDVVLIESTRPSQTPLPVLARGQDDTGATAQADLIPPFPAIEDVRRVDPNTGDLQPMQRRLSFELDDKFAILGHHFGLDEGDMSKVTLTVRLSTSRLEKPRDLAVAAGDATDQQIIVKIPNVPADFPAGFYTISVLVTPNGKPEEIRTTNEWALLLAPQITSGMPLPAVARTNIVDGLGQAAINLTCTPEVRPEQRVALALGDLEVPGEPHVTQTNALAFIAKKIAAGVFRMRLRVDGVDSHIVDFTDPKKPQFIESQKVTIT
jgi:Pvc16 N-terminal domain